jgi:DNA modification methylase
MKELKDYLYYHEDNPSIDIYCGDCLEIMQLLPMVDLVITDPPYNAKDIGPKKRKYDIGVMKLPIEQYIDFCNKWFQEASRISRSVVFTPGITNTHNYPQPFWQICWHKPAAVSFNRMGGFNVWEPIFIYGEVTKARVGHDYIKINTLNCRKGEEKNHPCPKNLSLWSWLISHFCKEGWSCFDPFLGSGTTLVVCKEQNRNGIGIEISEKYCEMAKKRLQNTTRSLF